MIVYIRQPRFPVVRAELYKIYGSSVVSLYAYFRKMNYRDADITSRIGFYLVTELILEEYMKLFRLEQLEDEID